MQVAVKLIKLIQIRLEDSVLALTAYRVFEEKWELREVKNVGRSIESLLEIASEYLVKERSNDIFLLVEVEGLGLKVLLGEGSSASVGTIISQKPSYLRRILLFKCSETGQCTVKHEFKPEFQVIVYDGELLAKDSGFDFMVIECEDSSRVIFQHELILPRIKSKPTRKRRKRNKKRRGVSTKTGRTS